MEDSHVRLPLQDVLGRRLTDKVLMGEILFKLNKQKQATEILNKALETVRSEKTYQRINELIAQYG